MSIIKMKKLSLKDVINIRKNKYKGKSFHNDFWKGYICGWFWAYRDLEEILEQHKFNLNATVIKDNNS